MAATMSVRPDVDSRAGLVLLYAPNFEHLQPAYPFFTQEIIVGRDPTCSICIREHAVSRQHARIVAGSDQWVVFDMDSRNGTMVSGDFLAQKTLEPGDEVRIGDA